ncbi:molybdenum cofactor biosynthesis protein [Proteus mirabilis]|nr:molybdenum cofactor biosynthesis protein [Proteus mirabilis]
MNELRIGLVSVSDRASSGVYEDKGLPALEAWLKKSNHNPFSYRITFDPR